MGSKLNRDVQMMVAERGMNNLDGVSDVGSLVHKLHIDEVKCRDFATDVSVELFTVFA